MATCTGDYSNVAIDHTHTISASDLNAHTHTISFPTLASGTIDWSVMDVTGSTKVQTSVPPKWEWKFFGDEQFVIQMPDDVSWWHRTACRLLFGSRWVRLGTELRKDIYEAIKYHQNNGEAAS